MAAKGYALHDLKTRKRERSLCLSAVMTILVAFHQNHYRNFKHYYSSLQVDRVQAIPRGKSALHLHLYFTYLQTAVSWLFCVYWRTEFPGLASRL
ncbi:hypothetical protein NC994_27080 [Trichocoleus sp. AS-A1]|nr:MULTISPECIES: hypothetical protein [unclassified Coleofasciculus]